MTKPTKLPNL